MSSHDRSEAEARSTAAGYDRHLQKPINPGEIEEIAAEAWRHRTSPGAGSAAGKLHTVIFSSPHAVDLHRLSGIVSPHVSGYSVFPGAGIWRGKEEHAYMLVIVSETAEPVADLVRDLKINFRQESVVQITHPAAAVRFV